MSTRSTIAVLNENDNTVVGIYCHWDGYIQHNGKILAENYNDEESARKLVSLGDLSDLGETIEECFAYGRDGGEHYVYAETYYDWTDFLSQNDQEYNYLFVPNEGWRVQFDDKEMKLSDVLE